jgi:6-phosphogluconolactonase
MELMNLRAERRRQGCESRGSLGAFQDSVRSVSPYFVLLAVLTSLSAGATAQPSSGSPHATAAPKRTPLRAGKLVLYAGAGADLTQYDVDVASASLVRRASVILPASIQEAWIHPSGHYLYVGWSDRSAAPASKKSAGLSGLSAFRIDPESGGLEPLGTPASLPSRPVYVTGDTTGTHVVVAYNEPSGVTVHRIRSDGTIDSQVQPNGPLDVGIYAHSVRVAPSNQTLILVTRGNAPTRDKPEDPGALKIFRYQDGVLSNLASIAPGGGLNFQARHLDFHPSRPWVFLVLERQSKLEMFEGLKDGSLSPDPLFTKATVARPESARHGQAAGTVHVHANGNFVYVSNRGCDTPADCDTVSGISDGENSIAVFSINQRSGEPTLIQTVETQGLSPRTFAIDASGRILVVGNQLPLARNGRKDVNPVPASLAVFRANPDGKLEFSRKYDVETADNKGLFWVGMVSLPAQSAAQ